MPVNNGRFFCMEKGRVACRKSALNLEHDCSMASLPELNTINYRVSDQSLIECQLSPNCSFCCLHPQVCLQATLRGQAHAPLPQGTLEREPSELMGGVIVCNGL